MKREPDGEKAPSRNQGAAHPLAKLTDDEIREIRSSTASARSIAAAYGVSRSHVANIRAGRRWPHI